MLRAGLGLAPMLLVGCIEVFGLEDPRIADGSGGSGAGSGALGPDGGTSNCPGGVVAEGRCFEVFDDDSTWAQARDRCASRATTLAKMESNAVKAAVAQLLAPGDDAFLGASDEAQPGVYLWLDGTPVAFQGWLPAQPDFAPGEHCMSITNAGTVGWEDVLCTDTIDYICERPL